MMFTIEFVSFIFCTGDVSAGEAYFLRSNLAESVDFHLLPEPVFNRLRDVYGLDLVDRDYICRKVVSKNGKPVVEVYPRVVMVSSISAYVKVIRSK